MLLTRTLNLAVYGNPSKMDAAKYTASRYMLYLQHFLTQLYFQPHLKSLSTSGMGGLANMAQHKAQGILRAQIEAAKATGNKTNLPQAHFTSLPIKIERSKKSCYDFWVSFEDQFSKKRIKIPAKSHKRLNQFLRNKWDLNPVGELVLQKNGRWQARIFVQKEVEKPERQEKFMGVDVGVAHCVARSDGYLGKSARKIIRKSRSRDAEHLRQGLRSRVFKTSLKQQLDVEVRRALARCKQTEQSLSVESPKVLANLRSGKLQGWARSYFANRCLILGPEMGVFVWTVGPQYTSQTCYKCGYCHRQNRLKTKFKCLGCGSTTHADINAARVTGLKGFSKSGEVLKRKRSERGAKTLPFRT